MCVYVCVCVCTSKIHSCCKASSGLSLLVGSQLRHCLRKSRNRTSLVFTAADNSLVPGRRLRPLEFVIQRGLPLESDEQINIVIHLPTPSHTQSHIYRPTKMRRLTKEKFSPLCLTQYRGSRHTKNLHDTSQLLHFILPGKEGVASVELSQYAAKTPHVYSHTVW